MAFQIADRVRETTATTGTGTLDLDGAATGFQSFVAGIGSGNWTHYAIADGTDWETGIGTVTSGSPDTLSRTTILESSNGGAAVSWGSGTKDVRCVLPASVVGGLGVLISETIWFPAGSPPDSVYTYTPHAALRNVQFIVTGGGGASGGVQATDASPSTVSTASGGGAGGTAIGFLTRAQIGASQQITVGAGGAGGAGTGGAGADSTVGALMTGGGGAGGLTVAETSIEWGGASGGIGGTASGGSRNLHGGGGFPGVVLAGPQAVVGGNGGGGYWGGGGAGGAGDGANAGQQGLAYGSGGGAPSNGPGQSAANGTDGADGIVIALEYG